MPLDTKAASYLRALGRLRTYKQRELADFFGLHRPEVSLMFRELDKTKPSTEIEQRAAKLAAEADDLAAEILMRYEAERELATDEGPSFAERMRAQVAAVEAAALAKTRGDS